MIQKASLYSILNGRDIRFYYQKKIIKESNGPLYYSNVSREKRKKQNQDELIPSILQPDGSSKEYRKDWARLIQKIYEVDPLACPRCQGRMRIIAFIEDPEVIKKILKHLDLWNLKARPPPGADAPPKCVEQWLEYSDSQLPPSCDYLNLDEQHSEDFSA